MNTNLPSKRTPRRALQTEQMHVQSLHQVDALVGEHVMTATPHIYWEDSCTQFRFETLPEALEAMRDPFFSAFTAEEVRQRSSLREVREFPAYASHLETAMEVVEALSSAAMPLTLWRNFANWSASFLGDDGVEGSTASLAICLAALRARGIQVEFEEDIDSLQPSA